MPTKISLFSQFEQRCSRATYAHVHFSPFLKLLVLPNNLFSIGGILPSVFT